MPNCIVRGCIRAKNCDHPKILHCFPKQPEKIKQWLQQTGQYGIDLDEMVVKVYLGKINDKYRMCSLHFSNDCYHHDLYRRILKKNAIPTIFNTIKPSTVSSTSVVSTNSPSVSAPSSSSNELDGLSAPPPDSQKTSCFGAACTCQVEYPVVHSKASSQPTIQQTTLVPVVPQHAFFQTSEVSRKRNQNVGDRSVTIDTTTSTTSEATQMHSALSGLSPQSSVSRPSTSFPLEVPMSNSDLPLDTQLQLEVTSSSTETPLSTTSSCPIISLSPASSQVISTSVSDKSSFKTLTVSPVSIPLTVNETKPCSTTVLPVSGNVPSITQSQATSGLAQKPPSISVVHAPLKTPTSRTAITDCPPSSKKRKLDENISVCKTSINKGKFYIVSSTMPLVRTSPPIQKPLMVDKGVNTDFFTNRRSCCVATDPMHRKRIAQTQTRKIYRKHQKIMCNLLVPVKRSNRLKSNLSLVSPEDKGCSDCSASRSSDGDDDSCEVLEAVKLSTLPRSKLSDSKRDVSVPNSSDKKQAIHITEENESSAGQATLSPTPLKSTCTIPDFDINILKMEPNIKAEEDQFPISNSSQKLTDFVLHNPKTERIPPIKSEPLAPVCRNPTSWETSAVQTDDEPEDLNDSAFHIDELSEDEDESFLVPSDAEDEDDIKDVFQDLDSPVENPVEEEKYIVFESCLRKLIMMIPCMSKTKCMSPLTQYRKETTGSHLSIEVRCSSGHTSLLWESQPRHGYQPLGNVLLSAAVLFSGSSFLKSQHMFKLLNLKSIDKTTHHKNQYMYLYPAISHHWKEEQKEVLRCVQEKPLCLAGDQQLDKPGFSAKYSIYSLMDVTSKKMCSFSVEPVNPEVTLDCLEKTGFQKAMDELQIMNVDVKMIVTDRSVAIQEVLKDNYPDILHRVDLWHLSKSIGNEVLMAAKHKDCEILYQWVEAIRNHIWWSSHTCCRNPDLLIQKWNSVIQHVSNVHEWDGDSDCKACPHPPLPEEMVSSTNWLEKDSTAYEQLKKIVENTSLLSDLKRLSFSCHTGELEIYHGTCLKYHPKTLHFFMDSMVARTQLAALDHNRNVHRVKAEVQNASSGDDLDTMTQKLDACKGQRSWITKALYKPIYQNFLFDIMNDVIAFIREEKTFN
ncbi:uncharacterized protein [Eleutherodactylus coqui]|uniref:uncharacterized protein n=1 Tax=Eleutherodactylus coqui TaxID=57060 RepID=UPI0034618BE3